MSKITAASLPIELKGALKANSTDFINVNLTNLANYNEQMLKQFGYMDNQGLAFDDEEGSDGAIYIDELYVLPNLSENRLSPETLAAEEMESANSGREVSENEEYLSLTSCLVKNQRLVLLGDPGVGKTTLVQWLVCSLSHPSSNFAKERLGPLFPLLLTARKLPLKFAGQDISNDEFIETIFGSQSETLNAIINSKNNKSLMMNLLDSGQVLFIVDGLDEVSSETAHWLSRHVKHFLSRYPRIRLILTSRIVGFDEDDFWSEGVVPDKNITLGDIVRSAEFANKQDFADENEEVDALSVNESSTQYEENKDCLTDFKTANDAIRSIDIEKPKVMYMAPFTPSQRSQFSKNWMNQYLPPNDDQRNGFLKGIGEVSSHSIQLNALSRIPVLLNLICFILWRRGKLPNGRAELYQRIVETYLLTMDKVRSIKLTLSEEYDYMDIKAWLGKLALHMQAGDLSLLDCDEVSILPEDKLEELRDAFPQISEQRLLQISESKLKKFLQIQLTEVLELDDAIEHVKELITYIKKRTGFLIPRGIVDNEEQYSFSHLSFQEYFSAYSMSKNLQSFAASFEKDMTKTLGMESWSEIWQLVFEEMSLTGTSRKEVEKLIEELYDEDDLLSEHIIKNRSHHFYLIISLYSKILLNPSVKLSNKFRTTKQLHLARCFLLNQGLRGDVFNSLLGHCIVHNREKLIALMGEAKELHLSNSQLPDYQWLSELTSLQKLNLSGAQNTDFSFLSKLTQLQSLDVSGTRRLDLSILQNHSSLQALKLTNVTVQNLNLLKNLKQLEELYAPKNISDDIESLAHLKNISKLVIGYCNFENLDILKSFKKLSELRILYGAVNDYSSLKKLNKIRRLDLLDCDIKDLTCLPQSDNLELVVIHDCDAIESYEPFIEINAKIELFNRFIIVGLHDSLLRWPELSKSQRKECVAELHRLRDERAKRLKT